MKQTTNYNLRKPDQTDFYDIDDMNANADIIDAKLKEVEDKADEVTGVTLTGTLIAGLTTLELTDPAIKTTSTIDPYTSKYSVVAEDIVVEDGKITLTFEGQTENIDVKVVIR